MRIGAPALAPCLVAVGSLALAPAAFAVDYLSVAEAGRAMFPDADRYEPHEMTLDAAQLQQLDAAGVRGRSARWRYVSAWKGTTLLGRMVVDEVIGKFELISYAVGLSPDGTVTQLEVLSYRESHGHEIRLPAWRRQFVGKGPGSALRVGDDIANLSGATLSCSHVTDGVRRIVAVHALARQAGLLG